MIGSLGLLAGCGQSAPETPVPLPTGRKDVSPLPNLIDGLRGRGYSDEDQPKVLGENLLRVWRKIETVASAAQAEASAT